LNAAGWRIALRRVGQHGADSVGIQRILEVSNKTQIPRQGLLRAERDEGEVECLEWPEGYIGRGEWSGRVQRRP
jgi:hypothetical protein